MRSVPFDAHGCTLYPTRIAGGQLFRFKDERRDDAPERYSDPLKAKSQIDVVYDLHSTGGSIANDNEARQPYFQWVPGGSRSSSRCCSKSSGTRCTSEWSFQGAFLPQMFPSTKTRSPVAAIVS